MEPLIRLRSLGSEFDRNDVRKLINKISQEYGTDAIFSFMFNHFLTKYKQSGKHDNALMDIIGLASQIIISKQADQQIDEEDTETNSKVLIHSMPSALIGNCASYLPVKQYLRFSVGNRKIFTACNSPSTLQELNMSKFDQCDLNLFPSLVYLKIECKRFNEYMQVHPRHRKLRNLTHLVIQNYEGFQADLNDFLQHDCIDLNKITSLECHGFGLSERDDSVFSFDAFFKFALKFPNV